MTYVPSPLTCPGSLVWAVDIDTSTGQAACPYCQATLPLEPGDRSGTLPAHDAADDRLPIPAADLPDLILEVGQDPGTTPFERAVVAHIQLRLTAMYERAAGCVDPDHGIGDHPCDEVLGRDKARALRDTGGPPMITISLPEDIARLVYDELQGRDEWLGSSDLDPLHERVRDAVRYALDALDAAGSGPTPRGTYP